MGTLATAENWAVTCGSCAFAWKRTGGLSDYERQAIESRPCPGCGAYTLSCSEPRPKPARRETREAVRARRAA
ncbi:MAG TPA: hypothetical protein VGE74_08040 [Gemmata sp.]